MVSKIQPPLIQPASLHIEQGGSMVDQSKNQSYFCVDAIFALIILTELEIFQRESGIFEKLSYKNAIKSNFQKNCPQPLKNFACPCMGCIIGGLYFTNSKLQRPILFGKKQVVLYYWGVVFY